MIMLHDISAAVPDCAVCGLVSAEVRFFGVRECQHRVCGVCAVKLAVFSLDRDSEYDYSKCVICKDAGTKIIISSTMKPFDEFNDKDMIHIEKYDIYLDGPEAHKFYKDIVKIQCHTCHHQFVSLSALLDHVSIHNQRYCNLCVDFKKCLPSEFMPMSDNDFHYHNTKEHPKCTFCNKRFYDTAHLIKHVKESHFLCDICNRTRGLVAYSTQDELLKHFQNDHLMCEICRAANVINVFESDYNLKTHKVLEHDNRGLVTEGLVNVNYGDTNTRYGARRRPRENEDSYTNEVANLPSQNIPEIMCEEAFPRLNSEQVQQNRQLGSMSVTNDDNDARRAFTKPTVLQEDSKKSKNVSSTMEPVPQNKAYSSKRNMGNLTSNDFPSLLSDVRTLRNKEIEYNKVKSIHTSKTSSKTLKSEEEYPSLSSRSGPSTAAVPTWRPMGGLSQKSSVKQGTQNTKSSSNVREASPPEVSIEAERESENKPKIQIVNREDFEKVNVRNDIHSKQRPPQDEDFPTLGNVSRSSAGSATATWGLTTKMTEKSRVQKTPSKETFTASNPLDFPELPFKSKPVESINQNHKSKNKQKKNQNFADAASSSHELNTKSKVYSLKSLGEQFQKQSSAKPQPEQSYEAPKSSSTRAVDYVPCVVPTNENVVLVDSKTFQDFKKSKTNNVTNGVSVQPKVAECESSSRESNNPYDVLLSSTEMPEVGPRTKNQPKNVFKTSSYSDFPDLPFNVKSKEKWQESVILGKMDNFAEVAASSEGVSAQAKVYSLKSLSDQFQRPAVKVESHPPEHIVPISSLVPSASLRGIDYVPCVEPRNENVTLVDSKVFSELKKPKQKETPFSEEKTSSNKVDADNQPSTFNTSDFPELPVKPKPHLNPKMTTNPRKKDNFAGKLSQVKETKSAEESTHKSESRQCETTTPLRTPPFGSLRGSEYVPCVDPRNEAVVLVNSEKFSDLKRHDSEKVMVLNDSVIVNQKSKVDPPRLDAPKLSSSADFPSLEPSKVNNNVKPKIYVKEESIRKVSVPPVVSLMDIATFITNKTYTAFPDADERNQRLFEMVNNSGLFDSALANKFLSLSGSYRNRKSSVQDYMDSIHSTFKDHMVFIAEVLPQMLVLLPDISLQKCLLSHMPQQWTLALRECSKCGQIINKCDIDLHDMAAHH